MKKKINKRHRVAKSKNQSPLRSHENKFIDYRERICDKCGAHVWADQNKHYYCGGNLP